MVGVSTVITSDLMLILPLPLLMVGVVGGVDADRHPHRIRGWTTGAAWIALLGAVLAAGTYVLGMTAPTRYLVLHIPSVQSLVARSVDVNGLTLLMLLLVTLVGMVVARYSAAYLDGDTHEGRFHRWLSLTLGSFLVLIVAGNIWEFLVFWIVTSLCLHNLLAFYPERPIAVLAARKKYLLHRIADASLFGAFLLISRSLHTSEFTDIAHALARNPGPLPESLQIAAGLIVLSAILKSAQFPFHGWLIQVMEAPTPVSALLHAGIIYTGTFLLLRTVPIMSRVIWTGNILIITGLVAITTTSLMMMTATNIKGTLAYSTSAQMGFMLLECGMGLYSLALLHIVSHSVYKAHAFLSSGSVVDYFRIPALPTVPTTASVGKAIGSLAIAAPIAIGTAFVFGVPVVHQTSLIVMGFILIVAVSQLLLQALNIRQIGVSGFVWMTILLSVLISVAYFGLELLFTVLFRASLPTRLGPSDVLFDGLLGLVVVTFVGLLLVQQMLPRLRRHPLGQAIYVHLYNDLYIDLVFTRLLQRFTSANTKALLPGSRQK